jgi:hypothetical protein
VVGEGAFTFFSLTRVFFIYTSSSAYDRSITHYATQLLHVRETHYTADIGRIEAELHQLKLMYQQQEQSARRNQNVGTQLRARLKKEERRQRAARQFARQESVGHLMAQRKLQARRRRGA